jgi:Sulfotransferase family
MARNILVVGMPRSGTSMTAGALARAGYHAADVPSEHLRPGDAHNPGGYWETAPLIDRNVEVLHAAGYAHDNTWLYDAITPEVVARLSNLAPLPGHADFVASWGSVTPWVWKDPRLCYTLGYWWKLLDPSTTGVLVTRRDPTAIYRSFVRLRWREPSAEAEADVRARIEDHLTAAWTAIETLAIPHIETPYETCLGRPAEAAAAMSDFTGARIATSDLNADKRYDHSSFRGRLATAIDRFATALPPGVRTSIKRITPRGLITRLFPGRQRP